MKNSAEQQKTINIIVNLMKERYKGSAYCFFYGSSACSVPKKNSDVDLIVVYNKTIHSYREKFIYNDLLMDVFVYDEESLSGTLHMARMNGKFVTVDAVKSAITLPAPTPESEKLKAIAQRVRHAGYIFQNRAFMQQFITNILDDLEDCTVASESNMLCIDLYKSIAEIVLIGGGAGICDRKHAARELTAIDVELHQRLDNGLLRALSGDIRPLVEVANEVLCKIGGPLRAGFHMNNTAVIRMPLPVL
jgi:predicted nucleotidyltransferase